jgi:polyphosphate kinase
MVQVTDDDAEAQLRRVLDLSFADDTAGWELDGEGTWHRHIGTPDHPLRDLQVELMRRRVPKADA